MSGKLWKCPLCKATNTVGSARCVLCRKAYVGDEEKFDPPVIQEKQEDDDWEEDSKVLKDLEARMEKASQRISQIGPESIPPRGPAIRLVIPDNPLGWLTVAAIVIALAVTLAILKTLF